MKVSKLAPQFEKYEGYRSLDFRNKVYQVKAFRLLKGLKIEKPKILELGCADGSFTAFLSKELNGEAWGVDIAPKSITQAKKLGVQAIVSDLSKKFPYQSNKFDIVVALETIEHIFDTDLFLKELNRVLKKGGYVVISTPNLASLQNRMRLLFNKYPRYMDYQASGGHIFLYTLPVLEGHLKQHNLKVIAKSSPNFFNPWITKEWLPNPIRELSITVGDRLPSLGSHLVIVAKKD